MHDVALEGEGVVPFALCVYVFAPCFWAFATNAIPSFCCSFICLACTQACFVRVCSEIVAISLEAFAFSHFIPLYPFLEFHRTLRREPTLAPFPPPFRPCRAAPARCTPIARQWAYFDTDTRPYRYPSVDEVARAVISSRYLSTSRVGSLDRRCPTGKPASVVARAHPEAQSRFFRPFPAPCRRSIPRWRGVAAPRRQHCCIILLPGFRGQRAV